MMPHQRLNVLPRRILPLAPFARKVGVGHVSGFKKGQADSSLSARLAWGELRKMRVRADRWPPKSTGFRVIQSLIVCAGLLLTPNSLYAQSAIPAINPLIDSLDLPDPIVQELNTLCSGSPQSQGCTTALGNVLAGAIGSVPAEVLGVLPELTTPIISALDLPGDVASAVDLPAPHCLFRQHVHGLSPTLSLTASCQPLIRQRSCEPLAPL